MSEFQLPYKALPHSEFEVCTMKIENLTDLMRACTLPLRRCLEPFLFALYSNEMFLF
jgi:hypothetical protein